MLQDLDAQHEAFTRRSQYNKYVSYHHQGEEEKEEEEPVYRWVRQAARQAGMWTGM